MSRISIIDQSAIARAYAVELVPMATLARIHGISRMAVWKILRKQNIETRRGIATQIYTTCKTCGKPIKKPRCQYRTRLNMFCCRTCYTAYLKRNDSTNPLISTRAGMRMARKTVAKHIRLKPGYVVHHEDRNTTNNDISNLRVFRSNADHVRYHRGFDVAPIWSGVK